MLGNLLAGVTRLVNVPARVLELVVDPDSTRDDPDNVASAPLEKLAKAFEEIDDEGSIWP